MATAGTIQGAALAALRERDPARKATAVRSLAEALAAGRLAVAHREPPEPLAEAGRPDRPVLVAPHRLPRRGLGTAEGRAALLHAVAHIEFNAINLALDAVYRFGGKPRAFYEDWASVALDEARHFELLAARLAALGYGYGDFPAHNGLWEAALATADSGLRRMALVPRVLEARGLDVSPAMIERLAAAGDDASADVLRVILAEEVRHVAIGTRWYHHYCERAGLDPEPTFFRLLAEAGTSVRPPFNEGARKAAGFSDGELARLRAFGRRPAGKTPLA